MQERFLPVLTPFFVSRFGRGLLTLFLVFSSQKPGDINGEKAKRNGERLAKNPE
jgi:hypothetical protein